MLEKFLDLCRLYQTSVMLFLEGVCIAVSFLTFFMRYLSKPRKYAIIFLELNSAAALAVSRFYYLYKDVADPAFWPLVRCSKFLDYFFNLTIIICFNFYLKDLITDEGGLKKIPKGLMAVDAMAASGVVMLIISHFSGFYYYWAEGNVYTHGRFYIVNFFFPIAALITQLVCLLKNYKRFSRGIRIPLLLFIVIPIIMGILQYTTTGLATAVISTVGMAIVLYIFLIEEMNKSIDRAHRLEIDMMAKYQKELEATVDLRTRELKAANDKVEHLLLNILPEKIARELAEHPDKTISKRYPNATVLFTDIVEFTKMSSNMTPEETVVMLNKLTTRFDERAKREGVEKIKTIGDAYMAASGLTEDDSDDGAERMLTFARGLLEDVEEVSRSIGLPIRIRIGINSGELVAGVIGKTKFIYDVWGDTVNIASRMESSGKPMTIHVSEATYERLKENHTYMEKAEVQIKGKGLMNGYIM